MSLPIRETPILKKEEAEAFEREVEEAEKQPAPEEEYSRANKLYREVLKRMDIF